MARPLDNYHAMTADWRKVLRQNNQRTYFVICLFFLIYAAIGVLIDMYLAASSYPQASIPQLFSALIQLHIFPFATIVMLSIAGVSLLITYAFYNRLMLLGTEYHEITAINARTVQDKQLYNVVEEMKISAGLSYMPKVYLIEAEYMNAFASGYSEKSAMVAITRGLIEKLNRDEIQAVMAHELSHIKHLDIKITLTATLLANLTIMVLDIFFYQALFSRRRSESSQSKNSLATIILILRYTLPIISALLLLYLSRTRELMADAGCVQLMRTNEPLASALIKIHTDHQTNQEQYAIAYRNTPHENTRREAYLYNPSDAGIQSLVSISNLFSTHPSLETRLKALGYQLKPKNK